MWFRSARAILLLFFLHSEVAIAFNQTQTAQRVRARWYGATAPLIIDPTSRDLSSATASAAISDSIQEWNSVSPVKITPSNGGPSTLSFSSDARYFGPGVVAVTLSNFNQSSGKILSADIKFSEAAGRTHCFTADPAGGSCALGLNPIFVGDVLSHELGHFLGMAHSEVIDSTMFYSAQLGQKTLSSDDIRGLKSIYGVQAAGTISGVVRGGNAIGIFGAHVEAISTRSGVVATSALSDENGTFSITGLDTSDTYYLYVKPSIKLTSLPDPYYSVKTNFCPGNWVGSFFEQCGTKGRGHPQPIALTGANPVVDVGVVTIRCNLRLDQEYLNTKVQLLGGTQEFVADAFQKGQSFVGHYPSQIALAGSFSPSADQDDTIRVDLSQLAVPASSPYLEFKLLTTALGSALDFSIAITGPSGTVIDTDRTLVGGHGIPSVEALTSRPVMERRVTYPLDSNPALNVFTITLKPRSLLPTEISQTLPNDTAFTLADRTWIGWVGVSNTQGVVYQNAVTSLANNSACLDAPYSYAVKPNPISTAAINASVNGTDYSYGSSGVKACGTIQDHDDQGPGGMSGSLMVGFCFAILLGKRAKAKGSLES